MSEEEVLQYRINEIISLNRRVLDLSGWIDFACNELVFLEMSPIQVKGEISELLRILEKIKPNIIVEIGTWKGGSFFLFSRVASKNAMLISIDMPNSPGKISLIRAFQLPEQKFYFIRSDSHEVETWNNLNDILKGRKIDFLFIDADHSYEAVKKDFEIYSPLVKEGGIIAFHDIMVRPPELGIEVSKLWNEIKEKYDFIEIIKGRDYIRDWGGIGVLFMREKK